MSDSEESSGPKRQRISCGLALNEDIKTELSADDDSEDDFFTDDDDHDDDKESNEEDQQLSFSAAVINSPCPLSASSLVNNEPVLLENFNSPSLDSTQESLSGHSQPTINSRWSTATVLKNIPFSKQNVFFGNPGSEPMDFFNFFFEDELLLFICEQTNAQAASLIRKSKGEHSRVKSWKDVTVSELKIFLGLLFHMGTIPLCRLQDYWKTDRLFAIRIFREQMPRNRFLLIMRCLYFTSESKNVDDPLYKIRAIIDYFNNKMDTCYYPDKELSLDESMDLWRGRLRFKQCIKNKRQDGIKCYMLTEPDGLVLNFRVYTGGQGTEVLGKGHAETVVMQLLENKLQNGHSIYMDSFYNSVGLAKKMLENQTYCTGMLRKDLKDNPIQISNKKLKKGENVALCKDAVIVGKFNDKRSVMYLTTEFQSEMMPVTNKRGQTTSKPVPIVKYNEFMSDFDRQNQLLAFYPCERNTLRWYLKLAIHTFQLLFINSYKMYNKYSGNEKKLTLYDYRLSVINQLLPNKTSAPVAGQSIRTVQPVHKISKINNKNSIGILKRKICRQCSKSKTRRDSIWHCEMCEIKPGLCFDCFDTYHLDICK